MDKVTTITVTYRQHDMFKWDDTLINKVMSDIYILYNGVCDVEQLRYMFMLFNCISICIKIEATNSINIFKPPSIFHTMILDGFSYGCNGTEYEIICKNFIPFDISNNNDTNNDDIKIDI